MKKIYLLGIILLLSIRLVFADITIFPNYYDVQLYPGENNKTSVYIENSYDEYYEVTINLSISNKTIANCTFLDYSIAKTYNISGLTAIQDYINISALPNEAVENPYCRITYNWTFVDVSAPGSPGGGGGGGGGGSSTPSGVDVDRVVFVIIEGKEGDKIYFTLNNQQHYVFFQEIKRDWAKLIISSPYRYIVELDEGKFDLLDMDNDGTKDLKVSLVKADGTWADVKLERYTEVKPISTDLDLELELLFDGKDYFTFFINKPISDKEIPIDFYYDNLTGEREGRFIESKHLVSKIPFKSEPIKIDVANLYKTLGNGFKLCFYADALYDTDTMRRGEICQTFEAGFGEEAISELPIRKSWWEEEGKWISMLFMGIVVLFIILGLAKIKMMKGGKKISTA